MTPEQAIELLRLQTEMAASLRSLDISVWIIMCAMGVVIGLLIRIRA